MPALPSHFDGIGYSKEKNSWPLKSIRVPVSQPSADQVLVHAYSSSLNPLEYKLALLNFFDRTPPVILGFDLAGIVVAKGANVKTVSVGDEVMAMADSDKDGGWATGGEGGYYGSFLVSDQARPVAARRPRAPSIPFWPERALNTLTRTCCVTLLTLN